MTIRTVSLLAAATCAVAIAPSAVASAVPAVAKPSRCGATSTNNGGRAVSIAATHVGCATAKAVARRANGKATYKTGGFTCRNVGSLYFCTKAKPVQMIGFGYRKPS